MLDWDRISELREEVGDAEFQVILEMFLDEVESAMMRLSAKDPKRLETSLQAAGAGDRRLSIGIQLGPLIGVQKGPLWRNGSWPEAA